MSVDLDRAFLDGPGEQDLVSVVIPSYNRAYTIQAAIDSVLTQSHQPVEVLVVDDGSSDNTRDIVEGYDPRVRYLHQPNAGVSAARNLGFRHARGEFVALLDSDDAFLPWKLEAQVGLMRSHPEVGMTWTDMMAVDEDGKVISDKYLRTFYDAHEVARIEEVCENAGCLRDAWPDAPVPAAEAAFIKGDIFSQMILGNLVHTSTVLLRRARLAQVGEFDVTLAHSGEDYEFHLRTCSFGPVGLLEASSILYRVGAQDQLTAPQLGIHRAHNNLTTVERWLARGGDRVRLRPNLLRWRLAQAYGWVGEAEAEHGSWREARRYLAKSLRYRPLQLRLSMLFAFTLLPRSVFESVRSIKRRLSSTST